MPNMPNKMPNKKIGYALMQLTYILILRLSQHPADKNIFAKTTYGLGFKNVALLAIYYLGVVEVARSSRVAPTSNFEGNFEWEVRHRKCQMPNKCPTNAQQTKTPPAIKSGGIFYEHFVVLW